MKTIAFAIGVLAGALLAGEESPVKEAAQQGVDFMINAMEVESEIVVGNINH